MPGEINRDFALYPRTRTSIAVLGTGRIDGFYSEEHEVGLRKTRYPVESGATLTDNAVVTPERLRLEGLVSDLLPAPGNTLSPDRATNVWEAIINLEKSRTPFDVVTPIRVYRDMLIVRAGVRRNNNSGDSLRFTLELEELLQAATELLEVQPENVSGPGVGRTSTINGGDRPTVDRLVPSTTPEGISDILQATNPLPGTQGTEFTPATYPVIMPSIVPQASFRRDSSLGGLDLQRMFLETSEVQEVPITPGTARETFRANLGGQLSQITVWFQPLDSNWYMSLGVADISQQSIINGVRLLGQGLPLLGQTLDFKGQFYVDGDGDPGLDSWGNTHRLLYLSEAALSA